MHHANNVEMGPKTTRSGRAIKEPVRYEPVEKVREPSVEDTR